MSITDSLFIKVCNKKLAFNIWKALFVIFQSKSRMVALDLRHRLQMEHCAEKGDMQAHFMKLGTIHKDLVALGQTIPKANFYTIILGFRPSFYDFYIFSINTATALLLGTTVSAEELMYRAMQEFDLQNLCTKARLLSAKKDENAAFLSSSSSGHG